MDSRIGKLTRYLKAEILKKESPTRIAVATANLAISTPGRHGFTPYEIYYGRDMYDKKVDIDLPKLMAYIKECREVGRQAAIRNQAKGRTRKPLIFRPFEAGVYDSYESETEKPIKIGDLLLIEGRWDKNDLNPYFEVVATRDYADEVDWYEGVVYTTKIGVQRKHIHMWSLSTVRAIVEGRATSNVKNAGLMMMANNEELLFPEFMHTRSEIFDRRMWEKPLIEQNVLIGSPDFQ